MGLSEGVQNEIFTNSPQANIANFDLALVLEKKINEVHDIQM